MTAWKRSELGDLILLEDERAPNPFAFDASVCSDCPDAPRRDPVDTREVGNRDMIRQDIPHSVHYSGFAPAFNAARFCAASIPEMLLRSFLIAFSALRFFASQTSTRDSSASTRASAVLALCFLSAFAVCADASRLMDDA